MNRYIVFAPGYGISETEASTPVEAVTHIIFRTYTDPCVARRKIATLKQHGSLERYAAVVPDIDPTGLSLTERELFREVALAEELAALNSEKPGLDHLVRARNLLDRVRPGRF